MGTGESLNLICLVNLPFLERGSLRAVVFLVGWMAEVLAWIAFK